MCVKAGSKSPGRHRQGQQFASLVCRELPPISNVSLTASNPTVTGHYDVPAVRFELVILIHHRPSVAQTITHLHQVAMASSAIASCCTAPKPSLKSSTRHSFAASRLPARRPQRVVAIAAKHSNKVRELQMAHVQQFQRTCSKP
jgi:hypothetical protein